MTSQKYELSDTSSSVKSSKGCMVKLSRAWQSTPVKILFLLLVVSLVIVIIVLGNELARRSQDQIYTQHLQASLKGAIGDRTPIESQQPKVCLTGTCIKTANRINEALNLSVSPCDNFYSFACGGWEEKAILPYHQPYSWSRLDEMSSKINSFFRSELEKPISSSQFVPFVKARTLYKTCINTYNLENIGLSEAYSFIANLGGIWPNTTAPYRDFDLTERLLQLAAVGSYPLITIKGDFHRYDTHEILVQLSLPQAPIKVSRQENEQLWKLASNDLIKIWSDLNSYSFSPPPPGDVFIEVYQLMGTLKMVLDDDRVKWVPSDWNNTLLTVDELSELVPSINWTRLFSSMFPDEKPISVVSVPNQQYLPILEHLISKSWTHRLLDNFLKFKFVLDNLEYFPYEYRKTDDNLINRIFFESPTWHPPPRYHFCVEQLKTIMPLVLARWYVDNYMSKDDQVIMDLDEMIELIRDTYMDILNNTDLLDNETSDFAIKKIKAMDKYIAFPQSIKNDTLLVDLYSKIHANLSDSFFLNVIKTRIQTNFTELAIIGRLTKEERDDLWLDNPFTVNGYYSPNLNRFTILAGILQGVFYDYGNPKYVNFGSMGFTIGHEFTHGFDDTGRHYGIDGQLNPWWTATSENRFEKVKKCFVEQYSNLDIEAFDTNEKFVANGNITLDENIADNGAVYVVRKAYEKWIEKHGEEALLPTPHLKSWQQMYYVAQAQGWCALYKESGLGIFINTFDHSQKEARVNGMLQNSPKFSETFECPLGSFMNPRNKCTLW